MRGTDDQQWCVCADDDKEDVDATMSVQIHLIIRNNKRSESISIRCVEIQWPAAIGALFVCNVSQQFERISA